MIDGRRSRALISVGRAMNQYCVPRRMGTRASNRAAVHGAKLPVTKALNLDCDGEVNHLGSSVSVSTQEEEVEKEINKGKEEKENERKEVEKTVTSGANTSHESSTSHSPPSTD